MSKYAHNNSKQSHQLSDNKQPKHVESGENETSNELINLN